MGVPQKQGYLFRGDHKGPLHEEQISPEILLQCSSRAKLALQRDFQPAVSAATPQLLPHSCVRGGKDMGVGYGIMSRREGEDLGQVWQQRRQAEASPGHEKGEGRRKAWLPGH